MNTLHSLFNESAARSPDQIALIFGEYKIAYGLLQESVRRLAAGLRGLGIEKGDRIAVMLPNVPHYYISAYAAFELGAVLVPINIMNEEAEITHVLADSGARILITWSGFKSQIAAAFERSTACEHLLLLGDRIPKNSIALTRLIANSRPIEELPAVEGTDLGTINYTSGIADTALGAELTHEAQIANANTCREMFRITPEERIIAVMPLFHPLGQTLSLNLPMIVGASVVLVPRFDSAEITGLLHEHSVTFMAAVPKMFKSLLEAEQTRASDSPSSLKYCLCYGGSVAEKIRSAFEEKFNTVVLETFGLTEAGPLVTSQRIDRDRKAGSAGLPLLGTEVMIRDESGSQLLPNQSGQVWIKSPSLMSGYYNRPEETARRLKDGWLFTGDMGYLDEDHYLYIQEREEDIFIKGGFQIYPSEIENVLRQHEAVAEAAVVGVPDATHGSEVKAFVIAEPEQEIKVEQLQQFCSNALPVYKSPKYIEIVRDLPRSPTGRVLKRVLRNTPGKTGAV